MKKNNRVITDFKEALEALGGPVGWSQLTGLSVFSYKNMSYRYGDADGNARFHGLYYDMIQTELEKQGLRAARSLFVWYPELKDLRRADRDREEKSKAASAKKAASKPRRSGRTVAARS